MCLYCPLMVFVFKVFREALKMQCEKCKCSKVNYYWSTEKLVIHVYVKLWMYICHSETEKTNRNSHRKIIIFSLGFRQGKWHFKERKRNGQKQKGKSQMKPKVKFQVQGRLSKSCLLRSNETRNGLALCFALFYVYLPFMCTNFCPLCVSIIALKVMKTVPTFTHYVWKGNATWNCNWFGNLDSSIRYQILEWKELQSLIGINLAKGQAT